MQITFTVPGTPAPQGSYNAIPRKDGGIFFKPSSKKLKSWRALVSLLAAQAMKGKPPTEKPVEVSVTFFFERPKSHYRTGKNKNLLKASAPRHHTQKPDVSKLIRAVEDAMTGIVYKDDSQISYYVRSGKYWTCGGPKAVLEITEVME